MPSLMYILMTYLDDWYNYTFILSANCLFLSTMAHSTIYKDSYVPHINIYIKMYIYIYRDVGLLQQLKMLDEQIDFSRG